MHSDRATIRDVAQFAGVSTATVSHVINSTGKPRPEIEERVRFAIKALDYSPSQHARELAWRRHNVARRSFSECAEGLKLES